jgi:uncharacterized protein involved in exopolysaccharide biosynthesis
MKPESRAHEFPLSQMIYGRLLLAYPRLHRMEYGAAMAQLFRDQCREAWNESRNWGLLKLWLQVLPDLASTSIMERLAALKERKTMTDKLASLFGFRVTPAGTFFRVFILVFLLVLITSVAITFILPESYASTARIKIESDAPTANSQPPAYDSYFIQTTFEVIRSQPVLEAVINKLNLDVEWGKKYLNGEKLQTSATVELLRQRLQLAPVKNSGLISITVYSDDKNEAAEIANAIAESYQNYRVQIRKEVTGDAIDALQEQYRDQEKRIREAQAEVEVLGQPSTGQATSYLDKTRELDNLVEFHKTLFSKIEDKKLEAALPGPAFQIIDRAEPGHAPVKPNKPVDIVLGAVAGIFLASGAGTASAFLSFFAGRRLRKNPAVA